MSDSDSDYDYDSDMDLKYIIDDAKHTDLNGFSIVFTFVYVFVFIVIIILYYAYSNIQDLRDKWEEIKCFEFFPYLSGIVVPQKGTSYGETVMNTLEQCNDRVIESQYKDVYEPIRKVHRELEYVEVQKSKELKRFKRAMEDNQKSNQSFLGDVKQMFMFLSMYLQKIFGSVNDSLKRFVGTIMSSFNTIEMGAYTIHSILDMLQHVLSTISYILFTYVGAQITVLVLQFLGLITATIGTFFGIIPPYIAAQIKVIITIITTITATVGGIMSAIFSTIIAGIKPPFATACFGKDTPIKLMDGIVTDIQNVRVHDMLEDGSYVVSIIKVPYDIEKDMLVNFDGIIVTKEHKIKHKHSYIEVGTMKQSKTYDEYKEQWLYCLNTNTKQIPIKGHIFLDWDDMDNKERNTFETNYESICKTKYPLYYNHLFTCMISGFHKNTYVKLYDDSIIQINQIKPGDITENNEIIYGVMIISGKYSPLVSTDLMNNIYHTSNIRFTQQRMQLKYELNFASQINDKQYVDEIIHVITNKGTITLHEILSKKSYTVYDYDKTNEYILYYNNRQSNSFYNQLT